MNLSRERMIRTACALLLPFFICAVQWCLWSLFKPFVWFLFYPTVFFSSRIGGKYIGIVSTIISAGLVVYFFIPPQLSFVSKPSNNLSSVAVFTFMGFMFSYTHDLLEQTKRRAAEAELQAKTSGLLTERNRATADLIKSEERLRLALDATSDALWDWDVQSGMVFRSPRYYELVRRHREEDWNKDFTFFTTTVHPDDLPHVLATIESHKAGKSAAIEFDYRLAGPSAGVTWLRVRGRAVQRDEGGAPLRIVGTLSDVTESKRAEQILRDQDATYRSLFNNMLNSVIHGRLVYQNSVVTDMEFIATNPAFAAVTGITEPVVGRRISDVIADYRTNHGEALRIFGRVAETGIPTRWEHYLPELERWFSLAMYSPAASEIIIVTENITERKKAEHDLRESEERFKKLFFKAPLPFCFVNHRGELTAFNDRFERTFGYNLEDIPTQEQWWLRAYPDERYRSWVAKTWFDAVEKAATTSSDIEPHEYNVTCKDGSVRVMLISGITLGDDLLATFIDMTEFRRKEQEAETYRTKLETALASMSDAVFISDADGRFINFNDAFVSFHKFKSRDECATTLTAYPEIIDVHLANGEPVPLEQWAVSRALRGETATNQIYTLRRRDTDETWVGSYSFAPMRDNKRGRIMGAVVAGRDITDLVQSEKRLRESEASLRQAQRLAKVGNWSWDTASDVHYWSEEIYHIYGRNLALPPATYPEVATYFTPASWNRLSAAVETALARGETYECDAEVIRPDGGQCWVVARGRAKRDTVGRIIGLYGTVQDITERKLAEEAIRELNLGLEQKVEERTAELVAANRELDAFAYAVSHDLRAPLRAMTGFSQALLEDFGTQLQGEGHVYLDQIILASNQMGALIDGLLSLSRSTRGEMRHDLLDLSPMVERLRDDLSRQELERDVAWDIESGMWVHGDGRMLEVVMRNLVDNAWKYTRGTPHAWIRVYSEMDNSTRHICVADNGAGFDMSLSHKLFTPFQRLHRQDEFPGIGIGLATVQRIIHRHGGEITATGGPGAGATFRFSLPAGETER
jgi:PAS domain S-box-containing protein